MTPRSATRGSDSQEEFFASVRRESRGSRGVIPRVKRGPKRGRYLTLELDLSTASMRRRSGGMTAREVETVHLALPESPNLPPTVWVDHDRFIGVPHVLTSRELCVYLDPAREWDPRGGARAFLDRLFRWFEQAVANEFNPDTALFHPVGGRAHFSDRAETVVCREEIDGPQQLTFATLTRVNDRRQDLHRSPRHQDDGEQVLVVRAAGPLYYGPGQSVSELFHSLGDPLSEPALTAWTHRVRRRVRQGADDAHIVVAVPRPNEGPIYLLVGRVELGGVPDDADVTQLRIEWCRLSDERPSISSRRDKDRPVSNFHGAHIAILGCGGLGSWMAEYVVRAGAASLELVDYGSVTGGLLVRQNFTDGDVGHPKAEALAMRLRAVAPDVHLTHSSAGHVTPRTIEVAREPNGVIIDATISKAIGLQLDQVGRATERAAVIAQVATDVATGALGMAVVSAPGAGAGPLTIDEAAWTAIEADGRLEPYFTFWEPREADELIPARGCSVPTFHGSAADLAAVAAVQANLIAGHLTTDVSGTHLFALPHTGVEPHREFLQWEHIVGT